MRKLFMVLLGICLVSTVSAKQAVIFNKSKFYSIQVSYQLGNYTKYSANSQREEWSSINVITVPPKTTPEAKNYVVVPVGENDIEIGIVSAVEKNNNGNIVSQGQYSDKFTADDGVIFNTYICRGSFSIISQYIDHVRELITYNSVIALNDNDQSPLITCNTSSYKNDI